MSTGQALVPPTRPCSRPLPSITRRMSGLPGSHCEVSARPTSTLSGWIDTQLSSNWCEKPAPVTTAHASSRVTSFIRSRIASDTLGRPSAKRSPFQSGVYSISCSRVRTPGWAAAHEAVSTKTTASRAVRISHLHNSITRPPWSAVPRPVARLPVAFAGGGDALPLREKRFPVRWQVLVHGVQQHCRHGVVPHDHRDLDRALTPEQPDHPGEQRGRNRMVPTQHRPTEFDHGGFLLRQPVHRPVVLDGVDHRVG